MQARKPSADGRRRKRDELILFELADTFEGSRGVA